MIREISFVESGVHRNSHEDQKGATSGGENLETLSNEEIISRARTFLGESITTLSQLEVEAQLKELLIELSKRGLNGFGLFSFSLPEKVTPEEVRLGDSSWAKVYRALFSISQSTEYRENPQLQMMFHDLQNIIDQNPQMMGPVAMWQIAKDVMWQKSIPAHVKNSLVGSMTYALAFFDLDKYESELLKNLDFEDHHNYTEVAHMLEAIKQFWSSGHTSFAEERVPAFYVRALRKIKETPEANYLLSVRAREILAILEQSEDFPDEVHDIAPFELAKDVYASTQATEGVMLVPREKNEEVIQAIGAFNDLEKKIIPPQWMVDEAIARGETWITWQPPQALMHQRRIIFDEMHQHATIPLADSLDKFSGTTEAKTSDQLFDYEYLVSRPVREMIQREFNFALHDLTIPEQFHFLNYLKQTTVASVETMRTFIQSYGINALRSFLATSHDPDAAENIMIFGMVTEPETAEKVFSSYVQSIDTAKAFGDTLSRSDSPKSPVTLLVQDLQQGMIKRAGHLFRAAKEISLYEYSGEETMGDLINAYSGVARVMDVLASIEDSTVYTIKKVTPVVGDPSMHTTRYDFSEAATGNIFSLKVAIRPQAADRGEARINFELSLDQLPESDPLRTAFYQTTEYKGANGKKARQVTGSVIRLGFDLDARTNPPTFSFDMGRDAYEGDDMRRTGDVLGRILSTVAPEGHHLTDFSPALSKPENFSAIARAIAHRFSTLNPTEGEEPSYYLI